MASPLGTSGITVRSGFMQENAQLHHFPKNEIEWGQFIRELARWRNEYEGTVDLVSTGLSSDPVTFTATYYRYGKIVILNLPVKEGTSDSTSFFLGNVPKRIRPAVSQTVSCINLVDNGTPTRGECTIDTAGLLTFFINGVLTNFTGSGQKGFGDVAGPTLIYSLFDAARID